MKHKYGGIVFDYLKNIEIVCLFKKWLNDIEMENAYCLFLNNEYFIYICLISKSPNYAIICEMHTLNTNQSNVSTKLKKHDFVIQEIEVTSQFIDLRSSATL